MNITTDTVENFLRHAHQNRVWLAEEIGCNKGTLNNWMAANKFPVWAQKSLSRLIMDYERRLEGGNGDALRFSISEWLLIQSAINQTGAKDFHAFARAVLIEKAKELNTKNG